MNGIIFLTISALIYTIITAIVFFKKEKIDTLENKIFKKIIILTIISAIVELLVVFVTTNSYTFIQNIVLKTFNVCILSWIFVFGLYSFVISHKLKDNADFKEQYKKIYLFYIFMYIISIIFIVLLPVKLFLEDGIGYSYGPSTNMVFCVSGIIMFVMAIFLIMNLKNLKEKGYYPIIAFLVLMIIIAIVQKSHPELVLVNSLFGIVVTLLYHTIENPDLKMVEKLNYAKKQSELSNDAKNKFLKNMSHELMTPLNKAIGINSFNMENKDLEVQENAKLVDSILDEVTEISRNVIDTINLQTGTLEINNKVYNPKDIFEKVIKLNLEKAQNKNLKLVLKLDKKLPTALYGDDTKIKQVLMNLVDNAIKYTNKGYVKIIVNCLIESNECSLNIEIKDTGIGISSNNVKELFKVFSRIEVEKNITISGMGLGLAISKQIMDLMGGTIEVKSKENEGSTFTIKLKQELIKKSGS